MKRLLAWTVVVLFIAGLAGCRPSPKPPEELSFDGLKITVWDAKEPHLPGVYPYEDQVAHIIEVFEKEYNVTVEYRYREREEIIRFLTGQSTGPGEEAGEGPVVVYSTEWPVVPDGAVDVSGGLDLEEFHDTCVSYWTRDEEVLAVPAYVHWFCAAARRGPVPDDSEGYSSAREGAPVSPGKTGYWVSSRAFLRVYLDRTGRGWDEKDIVDYLAWVKANFGKIRDDPLDLLDQGDLDALYPVTPHLYRWLKVSEKTESSRKITIYPPPGPGCDGGFYYTVPGYIVLAKEEPYRSCATRLARVLSQNLGRWAARAIGGIPARVEDMPVFNVQSGFSYEERQKLASVLKQIGLKVPAPQDFILKEKLHAGILDLMKDYLSGKVTEQTLEDGIRRVIEGHNMKGSE